MATKGKGKQAPVLTAQQKAVVLGDKATPVPMSEVRAMLRDLTDDAVPKLPPDAFKVPSGMVQLPNDTMEEIERTINASIHELVFALEFIDQGDIEDAQNALVTVGMNVDRISQTILPFEPK